MKNNFALDIRCENKIVTVDYEKATPEKVRQYLTALKECLDTTWFGICPLFNMKPTEANTRVIRRWCDANDKSIPDHHWRMLLILVHTFNNRQGGDV